MKTNGISHCLLLVSVVFNIVTAYNSILLIPLTLSKCLSKEASSVMPWLFMHATTRLSSKSSFSPFDISIACCSSSMEGIKIVKFWQLLKNIRAFSIFLWALKLFLIYTSIIGIENKFKDHKKMENALIFFRSCQNLTILIPSIDELQHAIEISKGEKLDFDDSLVVACMNSHGITELASLDRHFDKVKGIKRIEL